MHYTKKSNKCSKEFVNNYRLSVGRPVGWSSRYTSRVHIDTFPKSLVGFSNRKR